MAFQQASRSNSQTCALEQAWIRGVGLSYSHHSVCQYMDGGVGGGWGGVRLNNLSMPHDTKNLFDVYIYKGEAAEDKAGGTRFWIALVVACCDNKQGCERLGFKGTDQSMPLNQMQPAHWGRVGGDGRGCITLMELGLKNDDVFSSWFWSSVCRVPERSV